MTEFIAAKSGETEQQWRQFLAYLFAQVSQGKATTGVLSGLAVAQTGTASGSVLVAAGAGVVQAATADGASPAVNDTQKTLDIFTSNPMGATPRNDIVVFDAATATIRSITGTPNAVPTDPTVPTSAIALARLRHAASATTIPTAKIDDLRTYTSVIGAKAGNKRAYWASYTTANLDVSGYATVTHGAGFTPTVVSGSSSVTTFASSQADAVLTFDTFTSTTFRVRAVKSSTSAVITGVPVTFTAFLGE